MRSSRAIARSRVMLFVSASYLALFLPVRGSRARRPSRRQRQGSGASLPAVTVTAPATRQRRAPSTARSTTNTGRSRRTQAARRNETAPTAKPPFGRTQEARTGTIGVYADSTSTATKTNTPLINIPQSVNVADARNSSRIRTSKASTEVDALCSRRRHPSGRRQPRRTRHSWCRFQRQFLRQWLP